MNLAALSVKPRIRFGMVLYKDVDDEYVTRVIPLTDKLNDFVRDLEKVEASGGGDGPEDLQSALKDAMKKIKWNKDGIRLCYIVTDAEPHSGTASPLARAPLRATPGRLRRLRRRLRLRRSGLGGHGELRRDRAR